MADKKTALSRIVGVEEHVNLPELTSRLPVTGMAERGFLSREAPFGRFSMLDKMNDTEGRLKELDAVGLSVQVLSYPLPGAALLPPRQAVVWAKDANDGIARHVAAHPDRYAAFAHLPLTDLIASADELARAVEELGFRGALVNGATDGRYLDHPSFEPLLARAEALDADARGH